MVAAHFLISWHIYHLQTKLQEGNVFRSVCLSTGEGGSLSSGGLYQGDLSPGGGSIQGLSLSRRPTFTVEERGVRILLECILVYFNIYKKCSIFFSTKSKSPSLAESDMKQPTFACLHLMLRCDNSSDRLILCVCISLLTFNNNRWTNTNIGKQLQNYSARHCYIDGKRSALQFSWKWMCKWNLGNIYVYRIYKIIWFITAHQRSCGKAIFSIVSVCHSVGVRRFPTRCQ